MDSTIFPMQTPFPEELPSSFFSKDNASASQPFPKQTDPATSPATTPSHHQIWETIAYSTVDEAQYGTPSAIVAAPAGNAAKKQTEHKTALIGILGGITGALLAMWIIMSIGLLTPQEPVIPAAEPIPAGIAIEVVQPVVELYPTREDGAVDVGSIAGKAVPSVVAIRAGIVDIDGEQYAEASGSGVIAQIDSINYVLTNAHVVDEFDTLKVVLSDGRMYDVELVGFDHLTDLAVLRIQAEGLVPMNIGDTDRLVVGDPVIAIGNPLGLVGGPTVTSGTLSAIGRRVTVGVQEELVGMLQTDAAITHGSSGGALVDATGSLIGITTAIAVTAEGPSGLGFAVPIETVTRVTRDIVENGSAQHPYLGIEIVTGAILLDDGGVLPIGAEIKSVQPGYGAAAAGLQEGDVITDVGGVSIRSAEELLDRLLRYGAGESLTLSVGDGVAASKPVVVILSQRPTNL